MATNGVNAEHVEQAPAAILARMETELRHGPAAAIEAWPKIRSAARQIRGSRPFDAILLTGCGDSYYAGLALRSFVEVAAGLPVAVLPAMEAVAFPTPLIGPGALVVGISASGKVERTIEAVNAQRGIASTVSITAYADSDLAQAADVAIETGLRGTPGPVPGTANFLGSMLGVVAIGLELAERRGTVLVQEEQVVATLSDLAATMEAGAEPANDEAIALQPPLFAIGSGPDYGIASFGVAKFTEAAATVGVAQDLEEWAHEQFFLTGPGTTVFVHASVDAVRVRARRVAGSVLKVGGRLVSIAPEPFGLVGEHHWPIPVRTDLLAPLVAWAPMAMTALAFARHARRSPFGIDLPDRMRTVDEDIYLARPSRA